MISGLVDGPPQTLIGSPLADDWLIFDP